MNADRHAGRSLRNGGVDKARIASRQFVGIVAAQPRTFAHFRITKVGEIGIVELEVAAARGTECCNLRTIRRRDIGEEHIEVGIGLAADRCASAAEMQHSR